jgi:Leucine-rich repeat (LRR) protein
MAYTEVLHSFKSLVFVSRVFDSIPGGGRSAAALLVMALCFAVGLALFLAALHFESVRDEQYAFIMFSTCAFFFAVPEFCADLYALRWWTDAAEDANALLTDEEEVFPASAPSGNRSVWSSDTGGSVQEEPNSIPRTSSTDHGSRRGQSLARNLFSTEEREDGQETGQADSMVTVSRALSVAVCLLSVVLVLLSYRALSPFADDCRRGSDTFAMRQALVSFASALHSDDMRRCPDVWPQLCNSSCDWGHDLLQCDSNSRPINLTLGGQQLSGSISAALGEVTSLQVIDISHNNLGGTIPSQLSSLSGLTTLDLSYNQLTSSIPLQLSSLSGLTMLELSFNRLTSTIPSQLASLSGLTTLQLSLNRLTGPVPWALMSRLSTRRVQVDVIDNMLTLPNDIKEEVGSADVTSVNVSGWGLVGTIPSQLSLLSGLTTLDLSYNQLTSTIPSQLSSLSGLTTLDLSYNALQGSIPPSLASLTALQVLRLNNNAIVGGTIPAGVPSVGFPQDGDCEMGGQCSACSWEACCYSPGGQYDTQEYDPTCTDPYNDGDYRRDTPMCRVCGFYDTGTCSRHSSSCANATRSERVCGANCKITTHTKTPGGH